MAKGTRNIEDWEAALIKAMLDGDSFTGDQIIAYFSRPDRTVNPYRIAEIRKGDLHEAVPAANSAQVAAFVRTYRSPGEARHRFFEENPLHPVNLASIFRVKEGNENILEIGETDRVECKESINFGNKHEYARVIANLANARGGFIVFCVRDSDKAIKGINAGKLNSYDPATLNQYLSEHFTPVPIWEKTEITISGKVMGLIYVRSASHKPIICTRDAGSVLSESEIYYRYPGETRRIKYAELVQILSERSRQTERQWADVLTRVERVGVENVAILDTATGEVSSPAGRFLIDEKLIPKLKFVAEGHLSETEGAPTLKLIGDVQPLSASEVHPTKIVVKKVHLTDADLMEDFFNQSDVADPTMYIRHLAHSSKLWLPAFYYIRHANLSEKAAIALLQSEKSAKQKHVQDIISRIKKQRSPTGAPKKKSVEEQRTLLLSKTATFPIDEDACKAFVKALRTLEKDEVDAGYVLPLLKHCYESFDNVGLKTQIQYALAHVDVIWHAQVSAAAVGSSPASKVSGNGA